VNQLRCWEEVADPHLDLQTRPDVLFVAAGLTVLAALASVRNCNTPEVSFRTLLADDAEVGEEYMASGSYARP
jgi:hypothetical protein